MAPMDQYQFYIGQGTTPVFCHEPPIRLTRSSTASPLPAVKLWTRLVASLTLLRQRVYAGWWAPKAVAEECVSFSAAGGMA